MKKIKLSERVQNATDAFFDSGLSREKSELEGSIAPYSGLTFETRPLATAVSGDDVNPNISSLIGFMKAGFLFIPGSFFLFKVSLVFFYVTTTLPHYTSNYGKFDYFFVSYLIENPLIGVFLLLVAGLMMYAGASDIRHVKNLTLTASIVPFSLFTFGALSFLPEPLRAEAIMYYSSYLFPLLLIFVGYVKYWIEETLESH